MKKIAISFIIFIMLGCSSVPLTGRRQLNLSRADRYGGHTLRSSSLEPGGRCVHLSGEELPEYWCLDRPKAGVLFPRLFYNFLLRFPGRAKNLHPVRGWQEVLALSNQSFSDYMKTAKVYRLYEDTTSRTCRTTHRKCRHEFFAEQRYDCRCSFL